MNSKINTYKAVIQSHGFSAENCLTGCLHKTMFTKWLKLKGMNHTVNCNSRRVTKKWKYQYACAKG